MTDTELEACFIDLADKEAFDEHYDGQPSPDDEDELPSLCERGGHPFGGFAVKVGDRWVCSDCEKAEYEDRTFDLEQVLDGLQEDEFSASRDEPW